MNELHEIKCRICGMKGSTPLENIDSGLCGRCDLTEQINRLCEKQNNIGLTDLERIKLEALLDMERKF